MQFTIDPVKEEDEEAIVDIFNHYIENSFAAYPEKRVPYQFFQMFRKMAEGYPFMAARDKDGRVLGFAMLRPYNQMAAFIETAEISCFIAPEYIGLGIGTALLDYMLLEAKKIGITSILAGISSLNSNSLAFHKRRGFVECGRFEKIGKKWGQAFDVVWMQKMI
jgi:phosphinothricin acetyltransferase